MFKVDNIIPLWRSEVLFTIVPKCNGDPEILSSVSNVILFPSQQN